MAVPFKDIVVAKRVGKTEEEVSQLINEGFVPGRDAYFKIITRILEKNKSGFLVGDGITFADIVVVENLTTLQKNQLFEASKYPELAALREKVYAIPAIKKWVEARPDTQY